jgi:hypothetical protein
MASSQNSFVKAGWPRSLAAPASELLQEPLKAAAACVSKKLSGNNM